MDDEITLNKQNHAELDKLEIKQFNQRQNFYFCKIMLGRREWPPLAGLAILIICLVVDRARILSELADAHRVSTKYNVNVNRTMIMIIDCLKNAHHKPNATTLDSLIRV